MSIYIMLFNLQSWILMLQCLTVLNSNTTFHRSNTYYSSPCEYHMYLVQIVWMMYDHSVLYQNVLLCTPSTASSSRKGRIAAAMSGNSSSCGPSSNSLSANSGAIWACRKWFDAVIHSFLVMFPGWYNLRLQMSGLRGTYSSGRLMTISLVLADNWLLCRRRSFTNCSTILA